MDSKGEIAKVAFDLYEKSGRIDGRDMENWVEAERIVKAKHATDDLTTKKQQIEENAADFMHAVKEVVKVTLHELSTLTRKVFK